MQMSPYGPPCLGPISETLDLRVLRKFSRGHGSGVAAVSGQWPGDESEDEVQRALAELS